MDTGWSIFKRVREQQLFYHVPNGWIFTVGGRWSYLVNAAQRAELLAQIRGINRWRAVWLILVLAVFALIVAVADRPSDPGWPHWLSVIVLTGIICQLVYVCYCAAMPYIQWAILRSILVGASPEASPPAPTPIDFWESALATFRDQTRSCSTILLAPLAAIFAFSSVMVGYDAIRSNGSYLTAILFAYMTLQFGGGLLLRLKDRRTPAARPTPPSLS
jgi:hypothetical protein